MKFRDDIDSGGPSNYVKLKDKETVLGVCRGEPYECYVLWENKVKTEVPQGTPQAKFNFKINFIVKEGSSYVAKVLEGGAQIYKQLAALSKNWDLEETVIIVGRDGNGMDTEYTVMPAPPKQQVQKEALDFIKTIELNALAPTDTVKEVKNVAPKAKANW
jgi:hypothetical protein